MPVPHSSSLAKVPSRRSRLAIWILIAFAAGAMLVWKPPFVVRSLVTASGTNPALSASSGESIASAFVNPIWETKVIPTITEKAVDAKLLIPALLSNPEQAGEKYGKREANNPFNYLVKGSGRVTAINTQSRAGALTVEIPDVPQPISLQIGPVILGTALRDATGLISFNQFTNQIDYAGVAKEMNSRAIREAMAGKHPEELQGKTVSFVGAFTYDPHLSGVIRVVPVRLEVQP